MRKIILSAALAAGAFVATMAVQPALAQSDPARDPGAYPAGPGYGPGSGPDRGAVPFTGPRVEATLGYDHVGAGSSTGSHQSINGLLFGGGIGYDALIGRGLVLGAEAEATGSTAHADRQAYANNFGYGRVRPGRDLYVGARIGTLIGSSTMIYAKGGYTNAQLHVLAGSTNSATDTNFKLDGYRVGAGVEHQFAGSTYGKVEYRYSNYSRGRIDFPNGASSGRFDVDTDRHQIAVSYGIRFSS